MAEPEVSRSPKLLDRLREALRLRHYSRRTEEAYVLWARRFFGEMQAVAGDVGARHLIGEHDDSVHDVEMDSDAVLVDVDSPDALDALTARGRA